MNLEKLIAMANQIGAFFEAMPDREQAVADVASHLQAQLGAAHAPADPRQPGHRRRGAAQAAGARALLLLRDAQA
jgi:hypothetical protein